MTRLDWDKAKRPRRRPGGAQRRTDPLKAQDAREEFVLKHGIGCFRCGAQVANWAKTGVSKRGPWAICLPCVQTSD